MSNYFTYKLNKNFKNEFILNSSKNHNNFFIIEDIDLITPNEIIRLLRNDRKIIFADFSIMDTSYLTNFQKLLLNEENSYVDKLFISKEAYIRTRQTKYYAQFMKELDFNKNLSEKDIFLADKDLHCAIQIKDLYRKNITIAKLDQSSFLKNIMLEKFSLKEISIESEVKEIINSIIFFKKYLIESVPLFFEKNNGINYCFPISRELSTSYKSINSKNIGIISAIDFDKNSNCPIIDTNSIHILSEEKAGWIDAVKIKSKIIELDIDEIVIENLNLYRNLEEIQVCNEYGIKNYSTKIFVPDKNEQIIPFYIKFDGWEKDISNILSEKEIPIELLYFLNELRKLIGVKIISTKLNYLEVKINH